MWTSFYDLVRAIAMATKRYCRNEGKLILRAFFARSLGGSTAQFCYYLLGGDTAVPSGLYARLCHTFLVITSVAVKFDLHTAL